MLLTGRRGFYILQGKLLIRAPSRKGRITGARTDPYLPQHPAHVDPQVRGAADADVRRPPHRPPPARGPSTRALKELACSPPPLARAATSICAAHAVGSCIAPR
eukprot:gene24506-biopygen10440